MTELDQLKFAEEAIDRARQDPNPTNMVLAGVELEGLGTDERSPWKKIKRMELWTDYIKVLKENGLANLFYFFE